MVAMPPHPSISEERVVFSGFATLERPQIMTVTCDRCNKRIESESDHYSCLTCKSADSSYNLCISCANNGIYCKGLYHEYQMRRLTRDGNRIDLGNVISSNETRSMLSKYPTRFQSPEVADTPESLFANKHRFIRKTDPREILIYTDGSCLRNGQDDAQAGCAFVFRPSSYDIAGKLTHDGCVPFRLEIEGPTGEIYTQTSNRAELRAVIGALQFRNWYNDCNKGLRSVIIATDSEYVAVNATKWVEVWENEGWTHRVQNQRIPIKNQDLWKLFLAEVRKHQHCGVAVRFWAIPRELNARADRAAKDASQFPKIPIFRKIIPDESSNGVRSIPWTMDL